MLREIGFTYAHRIDPFDGGPHFQARTDDITLVRATRAARVAARRGRGAGASAVPAIVAARAGRGAVFRWRCARRARRGAAGRAGPPATVTLALAADARDALQVAPGDEIAYLRLP